jgi:hypothetical protein
VKRVDVRKDVQEMDFVTRMVVACVLLDLSAKTVQKLVVQMDSEMQKEKRHPAQSSTARQTRQTMLPVVAKESVT